MHPTLFCVISFNIRLYATKSSFSENGFVFTAAGCTVQYATLQVKVGLILSDAVKIILEKLPLSRVQPFIK